MSTKKQAAFYFLYFLDFHINTSSHAFPFSVCQCCRKEEVKMFLSDPHVGPPRYANVDYITWCHGNAQKPAPTIVPLKLLL